MTLWRMMSICRASSWRFELSGRMEDRCPVECLFESHCVCSVTVMVGVYGTRCITLGQRITSFESLVFFSTNTRSEHKHGDFKYIAEIRDILAPLPILAVIRTRLRFRSRLRHRLASPARFQRVFRLWREPIVRTDVIKLIVRLSKPIQSIKTYDSMIQ